MDSNLIILIAIFCLLLIMLVAVARFSKPRLDKRYFIKHWSAIEKQTNPIAAIVAADSLVDKAMQHARIKGNTMGERLNNAGGLIRDIDGTWVAHKLRNRAVHEPGADLSKSETERALRKFKKALRELGAL